MPALIYPLLVLILLALFVLKLPPTTSGIMAVLGGAVALLELDAIDHAGWGYWFLLLVVWLQAWLFAERLATTLARQRKPNPLLQLLIPAMFGAVKVTLPSA